MNINNLLVVFHNMDRTESGSTPRSWVTCRWWQVYKRCTLFILLTRGMASDLIPSSPTASRSVIWLYGNAIFWSWYYLTDNLRKPPVIVRSSPGFPLGSLESNFTPLPTFRAYQHIFSHEQTLLICGIPPSKNKNIYSMQRALPRPVSVTVCISDRRQFLCLTLRAACSLTHSSANLMHPALLSRNQSQLPAAVHLSI